MPVTRADEPPMAPGATHPAGAYSAWSCTLTARNRLDISASQWNTSPIYGKVGSAVALKSLSVIAISGVLVDRTVELIDYLWKN